RLVPGGRESRRDAEDRPSGEIVAPSIGNVSDEIVGRDNGVPRVGAGAARGRQCSIKPFRKVLNVQLDVVHDAAQGNLIGRAGGGLTVVAFAGVKQSVWPIVRRVW